MGVDPQAPCRPHMDERHWAIVREILTDHPYVFFAFGSRVTGKHRPFSDLDLAYVEPIPDAIISAIEEQFDESDLPFRVDLVAYHRCSPAFQRIVDRDKIRLRC